jgi:hypothetical protein
MSEPCSTCANWGCATAFCYGLKCCPVPEEAAWVSEDSKMLCHVRPEPIAPASETRPYLEREAGEPWGPPIGWCQGIDERRWVK